MLIKCVLCSLQITTVDEAKQFYPLFGLGANVALIFSGRTVKYFSEVRSHLPPGVDGWAYSLKGMMGLVVTLGLVIAAIYWWVNKFVVNDPTLPKAEARKKVPKFTPKLLSQKHPLFERSHNLQLCAHFWFWCFLWTLSNLSTRLFSFEAISHFLW